MGIGVFRVVSDRTRGKSLMLHRRRFRLAIRKNILTEEVGDKALEWAVQRSGRVPNPGSISVCGRNTKAHGFMMGHGKSG